MLTNLPKMKNIEEVLLLLWQGWALSFNISNCLSVCLFIYLLWLKLVEVQMQRYSPPPCLKLIVMVLTCGWFTCLSWNLSSLPACIIVYLHGVFGVLGSLDVAHVLVHVVGIVYVTKVIITTKKFTLLYSITNCSNNDFRFVFLYQLHFVVYMFQFQYRRHWKKVGRVSNTAKYT